MTKYCNACKHNNRWGPRKDLCTAIVKDTDLVTGINIYYSCNFMRATVDCDKEAKLFEQKVTLWQRVKQMTTF
jgi:hypothetical protein